MLPRLNSALRLAAGLLVLLAGQWLGGVIAGALHIAVPGSVIGLVLLAAAIELGALPIALVQEAADLLVRHLGLLYVPAGAALVLHWGIVRREWVPIVVAGVVGTLAVLVVTGLVLRRLEPHR